MPHQGGEHVLVTGGAGYVGSAACHALHRAGRRHVVLDDLSTGHRDNVRWGPLVEGDIADRALVRRIIREHRVTAILHFAAKALVGESEEHPDLYDRWNRGKTTELAAAAVEGGIRAFVFSSSCSVYGVPQTVPIREDHPLEPVSPYGLSKKACEEVLVDSGLPTVSLRYFNACGGLPRVNLGERHDPETHLIPLAIRAARTGAPLTIFGTDYDTPDGTCIRDYVHVADLARVHLKALERLEAGRGGGAWNVGTGWGLTVRQILAGVAAAVGRPVPVIEGPRRPGDPPALVADTSAAERDLSWRAEQSDLRQVTRDAAACDRS